MEGLCGKRGWRPQRKADYITVTSAWGAALLIAQASFSFPLSFPLLLIRLLIFGSFLASPFSHITHSFWFFLLRIRCIAKSAPPCRMMYPSNSDIHPFSIRTNLIYFFPFFQRGGTVVGGERGRRWVRRSNDDRLITNLKFERMRPDV